MAREYKLGGKNPPRTPDPKVLAKHHRAEHRTEPEDWIPMHRQLDDIISFTYGKQELTGSVQRAWGPYTLIIASDGEAYLEDTRKTENQIRQLTDADRCPHCGSYVCSDSCPVKNQTILKQTMARENKIINVADVLDISPGDRENTAWVNGTLEAVVTKVKPGEGKAPTKAKLVHPEDDGVSITAIFWKRDAEDVEKLEGKLCSFNGSMTRTDYKPKQGPRIQQVEINTKTEIEVIGESAHSGKPLPHKASEHRDTPATRQKAPESQETASGEDITDTDRRAKCYFGVFLSVEKAYAAAKAAGLQAELSATDLKDICTGINMTYRGQYGVYMEPKFPAGRGNLAQQAKAKFNAEELSDEDIPFDGGGEPAQPAKKTEKRAPGWEEFVHPKRGVKLGEIEDADLAKFARWAAVTSPSDLEAEQKPFYMAVIAMAGSKGWDAPESLLEYSIGADHRCGEEFTTDDADAYVKGTEGVTLDKLPGDQAKDLIADYEGLIENIIAFAAKNRKQTSKPKKGALPD